MGKDKSIEFEMELKALLKKYNATLEVEDNGIAHHDDYIIKVYFSGKDEIILGYSYDSN